MNITHLKHGTGEVSQAVSYLLAELDHNGLVRDDVQILAGNADELIAICDSIEHKQKYKSAVFAFTAGDNPTREELDAVIADFEKVAFAGLRKGSYAYLAVLHKEADGGQHLHILSACIHLETGKAYNPAAPGWQADYGPMRDYWNALKGWARPDDPRRARTVYGKGLAKTKDWREGKDLRQTIATALIQGVIEGKIKTREDVLTQLASIGDVTKDTKSSISVVLEGSTKPVRLAGLVFQKDWSAESIKDAVALDRKALDAGREAPDFARAEQCLALFTERLEAKAAYNAKRFSSIGRGANKIEIQTMEVSNGPRIERATQLVRERFADASIAQERYVERAAGGILQPEFELAAGFGAADVGAGALPFERSDAPRSLGSINSINDVQLMQGGGVDDAGRTAASLLQGHESDNLAQGRSGGDPGLRWPLDDGQELINGEERRTSRSWRQDDARELAQRAIARAAHAARTSSAAPTQPALEVDNVLGRALDAAERAVGAAGIADQGIERARKQTGYAVTSSRAAAETVGRLLRSIASNVGAAIERCAQNLKNYLLTKKAKAAPVAVSPARSEQELLHSLQLASEKDKYLVAEGARVRARFKYAKDVEAAKDVISAHEMNLGPRPSQAQIALARQGTALSSVKIKELFEALKAEAQSNSVEIKRLQAELEALRRAAPTHGLNEVDGTDQAAKRQREQGS
jgi:hypothetical protein